MGRNVTLDSKRTFHDIKGILKDYEDFLKELDKFYKDKEKWIIHRALRKDWKSKR